VDEIGVDYMIDLPRRYEGAGGYWEGGMFCDEVIEVICEKICFFMWFV